MCRFHKDSMTHNMLRLWRLRQSYNKVKGVHSFLAVSLQPRIRFGHPSSSLLVKRGRRGVRRRVLGHPSCRQVENSVGGGEVLGSAFVEWHGSSGEVHRLIVLTSVVKEGWGWRERIGRVGWGG